MRKWVTLSLLLLAVVAFAARPEPPRIDPETGLHEEMLPERMMQKQPGEPSEEYLQYLARQAEGQMAETDAQWDPDVRLTNNSVTDYNYAFGRHTVAVDPSGRVHVVWMSYQTPGTYSPQVYYKRYYPGSGWTSDTCISADLASIGYSYYPALCVDSSGNVHVAWYVNKATAPSGYYIAYKMCTPTSSGNGGWEATTTRITEDTLLWYKYYPSIEASPNGRIHVVWYNYYSTVGYAIGYKEKIGTTWQPRVWVDSGSTSYYRWWPKVAAGRDNNIHVTWYGYGGTSYYQIGYRGRFGGTWGPVQQNISGAVYYQYYPSIAVNPQTNRVHIVWQGYDNGYYYYRIIHKQRLGTGISDTFQLVGDTVSEPGLNYYQYYPTVCFTPNGMGHVVWYGYNSTSPSYPQIRYNDRSASGTWGTPINLTNVTGSYRYYPSINNGGNSSNPNDVHVVWDDSRDGNYEIYYKHGAPPAPYDLAMYRIDVPGGLHQVGENVNPSVWVKNVGTSSVSSFSVKLDIGSSYTSTVNVNQSLGPGETLNVTGFSTWTPSTSGTYAVRCSVRLSGDGNPNNDRLTAQTMVADFVERFDASNGNFRGTGGWSWGAPQSPRNPPPSSPNCWGDVLSGSYANNANDTLLAFNLVALQDTPVVMFMHWMYCETYYDGGNFKYSTDGGQTWTLLYPDGTRSYYGTVYGLGEYGYSGNWNWEVARFKIPVANGTSFKVHWRFGSDGSVTYYGWLIDNIAGIGCRKPIDVAATEILAPTGTIQYGVPVTPQAKVWNFGGGTQTFPVEFTIGSVYTDTQTVSNLGPGDSAVVSFDPWTPTTIGNHTTRCVTLLGSDEVHTNDTVTGSTFVYLVDVKPTEIIAPKGEVDSGAVISPRVKVRNNGTSTASFYARLRIGSTYNQTRLVIGLTPGEERTITGFPNWTVPAYGMYAVRCSTELSGDMINSNDLLVDSAWAYYRDVAVNAIVEPTGTIVVGTVVTPRVTVQNLGSNPATFDLNFQITDEASTVVYDQTATLTLDPGVESTYVFTTTWDASTTGNYTAQANAIMTGDADPSNNQQVSSFTVRPLGNPGWTEKAQVPGPVKDGGFLAFNPDNGLIYAARGNKAADFYSYDPNTDAWTTLAPMPTPSGKMPSKGANGCYGDGYIYATIGNNTQDFVRYSIDSAAWAPLTPVPLGASNKKVKGGTDLVYVVQNDTGYVYLLKGYKQEFYRYNTVSGVWEPLPDAPAGVKPKWDKGSWLVYDGANTLYAHKAKYSEMWTFDLTTLQWSTASIPGIPIPSSKTGKNKKSKDGSDAVLYNGFIYALKGGNTVEWWKCDVAGGTYAWTELDPIPEVGLSGRKKRVKAGGAVASTDNGLFYAFKGGKTQEFWCYYEPTVFASKPERSGVMAGQVSVGRFNFSVTPNPVVKGFGILSYSVPQSSPARVTVFDVTGRTVSTFNFVASGTGTHSLDLRNLASGVYLVKFESAGASASQKLIVR
ncbi:T9SS type A sorting domain-containing protein [candidate division WOR-3 bacterium]|nr:T9SS type A sorting domain-containing protein [candidate division WOR-3 bacterium]